MSHTIREKPRLLARVRRIRGQVEAVERALESEVGCAEVLQLVASIRGAIAGLTVELMEHHVGEHILGVEDADRRAQGADELISVLKTYMK